MYILVECVGTQLDQCGHYSLDYWANSLVQQIDSELVDLLTDYPTGTNHRHPTNSVNEKTVIKN